MLAAHKFPTQNFEPTQVTHNTKTSIDHFHFMSKKYFSTETLETNISDHYSVSLEIPDSAKNA